MNEFPLIKVPYPPELSVEEILSRRSDDKPRSRAPNQYFIYRMAYIKELKKMIGNNIHINMIKISPQISGSWSKEPPEVKEAYKKLADLVANRLKELKRNDDIVIIQENFSSPPPPPPTDNNIMVDDPTFFYPYYLDFNYYPDIYYDFYNDCYYTMYF